MRVIVNTDVAFRLLDILLERWTAKRYPFNRPDAILPQTILPAELRKDELTLACFYFFTCIYMRGGIKSLQAFNALVRLWLNLPEMFDPSWVALQEEAYVCGILKQYIGWDSKAAAENWVHNARQLCLYWGGDPRNLIKGVANYKEACRRIRNKRTKRDQRAAGADGQGFRGFQYKMVSMLLYFYDWEGWLQPRFLYPSPADFHNLRLALANMALRVFRVGGRPIRMTEALSAPWRRVVMRYLVERGVDPIPLADALWLFSVIMCGNSPHTITPEKEKELKALPLFAYGGTVEDWRHEQWIMGRRKKQLQQTCFACPLSDTCRFAIPSKPYYRKGRIILRERPMIQSLDRIRALEPKPRDVIVEPPVQELLDLIHPAA